MKMRLVVHTFLPFTFLLILQKTAVQCQNEKDKKSKDILYQIEHNSDLTYSAFHKNEPTYSTFQDFESEVTYNAFTKNHPEFSNIEKDRTNDILYGSNNYRIRYFRSKRSSVERSLESIRKILNEERKKEREDQLMANDANPRMEANDTAGLTRHVLAYGEKKTEQLYNKLKDPLSKLRQSMERQPNYDSGIDCDFESSNCLWTWRKDIANGFYITTGVKLQDSDTGPKMDADDKEGGSYLLLRLLYKSPVLQVNSPLFGPTTSSCKLALSIYQEQMKDGTINIVSEVNHTATVLKLIKGDNNKTWHNYIVSVGKISSNFTILLEVQPPENLQKGATVAFDNIHLTHCYQENDDTCSSNQYKCKTTQTCINNTSICDITKDCPHGDDETQNCDLMPAGSRCNFEADWCGWQRIGIQDFVWARHNGSTPTNFTGPNYDHTYKNSTGYYLYVNMLQENAKFATPATVRTVDFNPPPRVHGNASSRYYNSCAIRFYLNKFGKHKSGLAVNVYEMRPSENKSTEILWTYEDHGDQWVRHVIILPNITHKYFIIFQAKKGYRYISDIAIDDVSLSPECFGLNIPPEELRCYNYWNPKECDIDRPEMHKDFINATQYHISTCKAKGRFGPTQNDCTRAYNKTQNSIKVMHEEFGMTGIQRWIVPNDGYYTIILAGASGGKGSSGMGTSRGTMISTVIELRKDQEVFMLVGQEGANSCIKSFAAQNSTCSSELKIAEGGIRAVLSMEITGTGGGGGGGTYVFVRNSAREKIPLAVAAGGGGLGLGQFSTEYTDQHGNGINTTKPPFTGNMYGTKTAGAGGGWNKYTGLLDITHKQMMGRSLLDGGVGGKACYNSTDERGDGGFGGGGGGCQYGGGGGGYAGGNGGGPVGNVTKNITYGEGGFSFLNPSKTIFELSEVQPGKNAGPGFVLIIPEIDGCNCGYKCVALDIERSKVSCVCPKNWQLADNKKTCIATPEASSDNPYPTWFVTSLIVTLFFLILTFGVVCFVLYNRYQQKTSGIMRRKILSGPDFQLDRLRVASDSMMTEYNPNYEFGGVVYTLKDLKDIPREQLRLVKALGQGAFGEVYQGFYRQRPCDTVEMPVAVKTLPEMSTSQAELDFLMEALIMSKFNHPNIVHFIGVCFDKHPRFIVLELLAGGDLKNFLRESRPKPERASPLTMKDLILISVDVAKGCKYLEDNRFIHRDIAARNCLLTTKGPGRVVKIADFGMSRDVYRSDYYRKGGKAMLPIKWMPPEAFLDGIFTSKTDVWSFGVLLWEIMSMGYMPYTGCANRDVMQLVTSGGRLDPPANCPGPVYGIMTQCWHPAPEQRPTFGTILERLGYCAQDPQVMEAPLPVFQRPPSNERDTTIMRPTSSDDNCLQVNDVVPTSSDYLIPNHTNPTTPDQIESTSSVEKLLPDNSDNWETSFIMPHSRSTQPLLLADNIRDDEGATSVDKLLSIDNSAQNTKLSNNILTPSAPGGNHNNNIKNDSSLKTGVSLDAGALAKQVMTPSQNKKYANINTGEAITSNGVLQNDAFSNHVGQGQKTEINC